MKTLERKNEGEKENLLSLFRKTKILLHMKFFLTKYVQCGDLVTILVIATTNI